MAEIQIVWRNAAAPDAAPLWTGPEPRVPVQVLRVEAVDDRVYVWVAAIEAFPSQRPPR